MAVATSEVTTNDYGPSSRGLAADGRVMARERGIVYGSRAGGAKFSVDAAKPRRGGLVSCPANSVSTESAAEARPLGAPTANTELYLREAQRRGRASAAVECQRICGTGH